MDRHELTIPVESRPYQGARAGVATRVSAAVIDGVVVVAILAAGYSGLAFMKFLVDPRGFSFPETSIFASMTAALVVTVGYLASCWWVSGRSLGGHLLGLRVIGPRGGRINPLLSLVRAAFCAFFPIGLLWCALSRSCRSVQDLVLHTSVVYDWRPTAVWLSDAQTARSG